MPLSDPVAARRTALPVAALTVLAATVFLSITAEMLPTGLLPEMSRELGVSEPAVGLLVSVFAFTVVLTSTPATHLTRRLDRKRLLVGVLVVLGLSTLASALAPNYAVLIAVRVAGGVAHGLFWAIVAAYASRLVPEAQIGRAVAVVLGGGTIALVLGVPASTMLGQAFGWRAAFGVVALLILLGALVVQRALPTVQHEHADSAAATRADPTMPAVLLVCAVAAITMLGQYAVFTYVAPLLTQQIGVEPAMVGPLLFVYGVAGALGLVLAGSVLARRPLASLLAGMGVIALAVLALAAGLGEPASIAAFTVWGVAFGAVPPLLQTRLLTSASPALRDTASALYTTGFNVGIGGGALVGAVLYEQLGIGALPYAYAAALVIAMLAVALPARRARRAGRRAF